MMQLYVGNLDADVSKEVLQSLFNKCGEVVRTRVVIHHDSGSSRGFGFVEMANASDGHLAISLLNGEELNGRKMKVSEAKSR